MISRDKNGFKEEFQCLILDNRLTDGGKVVSPTHRPLSNPQNIFLLLELISVRG
jgi:hypothetical protein